MSLQIPLCAQLRTHKMQAEFSVWEEVRELIKVVSGDEESLLSYSEL